MADEERGSHGLVTMISNEDEKKKQKLKKRKQSESSKSGDKSKKQKKNKSNKRDVSKAGGSVTAMEGVVEHDVIVSGEEEKIETDGECEVSQKDGSNDIVLDQPADKEDEIKGDKAKRDSKQKEKKKRWLEEATNAINRGICYLSRIPPRMDHVKLRQILSQYGEIQRIYLAPEGPTAQVQRKRAGGFRGQKFLEGWVEFSDKRVALRVAKMLNNEQIGGKKRSPFYYDIWNIKYLSKFKWDDLTEEIAYKNAIREQKLALELSAAKRERDFYLSKVDQSRALSHIEERLKKKQKIQQDAGTKSDAPISQQAMQRVSRQFPQNKPVANNGKEHKRPVSKDVLAGVFG